MPRRNNPFGPRNRPLPRSKRKELAKKEMKPLNVSEPSVNTGVKYLKNLTGFLRPAQERANYAIGGLLKRYGGKSDRQSLFGFIGELLVTMKIIRSETDTQDKQDRATVISGDFTADVDGDQASKFKRETARIGFKQIKGAEEPHIRATLGTSVFQNVNLITNLDDKYFNDIQRMVFAQIGIDLPLPPSRIPGKKTKKLSKKKVLQVTPVEAPQVFTAEDMVLRATEAELYPIPTEQSLINKLTHIEGVSNTRAKLIATDQTQKVFSALEEARGRDAGLQWYMWAGSEDNRERPSHNKNNNKIFHVDFPPEETGPPGRDVRCRCRRRWLVSKAQIMGITEKDLGYTDPATRKKLLEKLQSG